MKAGELVIYREGSDKEGNPLEYKALVLGARDGSYSYSEDGATKSADHKGENGEPLLSLVFVKERLDAYGNPLPVHGTGQTSELIQVRLDVAHESHEYDEHQQRHFGKKQYDGGRWREA
jgi:hypothetical protein